MRTRKKLGEMLVEANLLTEDQLKEALADLPKAKLKLGQYLIRKGFVEEQPMLEMLSRQLKIGRYQPEKYPLDQSLSQLIPLDYAQKFQIAPLKKRGRLLTICMSDPMDIDTLDGIEMLTNCEVEPSIGTERGSASGYRISTRFRKSCKCSMTPSTSATRSRVEFVPRSTEATRVTGRARTRAASGRAGATARARS